MSRNKSAKDIAFDKERAKFRQEIRELERQMKAKDAEIVQLKDTISEKENEICQLEDWVRRLLEHTELSEEDMRAIISKDKMSAELTQHISGVASMFNKFFGGNLFDECLRGR